VKGQVSDRQAHRPYLPAAVGAHLTGCLRGEFGAGDTILVDAVGGETKLSLVVEAG
jgi:hypothetical protein